MSNQTSLILFKPDAVENRNVGAVLARFESEGFSIRGMKMIQLDNTILTEHYSHVAELPFFPDIAAFMSQSPVIALALEGEDAISRVRDLLGPTNSKEAPSGTIRGDFGTDMMMNVCHASDGVDSAATELNRFFQDGELF